MAIRSGPKVLLFDVELSPNLAYVWPGRKYEVDVIDFHTEWQLLSVAWKWLGEKKAKCLTIKDFKSTDDKKLVRLIHALFNKANVLISHNGNSFDIKKCRARFLYHGLPPTKEITSIDTKLIAKRYFSFNSNSLDDLGRHLGVGRKFKHEGFELWLKCLAGDAKAFSRMKKYNLQDVELLERVYLKLRSWMSNHPNVALMSKKEGCPNCGHPEMLSDGIRYTATRRYRRLRCKKCFARHKGEVVK